MRRAVRIALLLALAAGMAGCPWNDPCWEVACGGRCTLCAGDSACQQAEPPRYCDAAGLCRVVMDPANPQVSGFCPAATP